MFMKLSYVIFSLLAIISLSGCAPVFLSQQDTKMPRRTPVMHHEKPAHKNITQVGRFETISNSATFAQKDPLSAIAQYKFGTRVKTVGQALWQVLQDTGYSLAPMNQLPTAAREVLTKPLPVTQRELGPISVRNALRTLMGDNVFSLVVNPVQRRVTFTLKRKYARLRGVK